MHFMPVDIFIFPGALTAKRKRSWISALAVLLLAGTGACAQNGVFAAPQPVGVVSSAQTITVTAQATGVVATVEVLTAGASGLDFASGGGASSCPAANLTTVGQQCTQSVTFTPSAPGLRIGAVVLLDAGNHLLATAYLSGTGLGGLGVLAPGNILPVAGDGYYKDAVADNIPATQAELYVPSGVTMDGAGNLYIADTFHNRIRMVCASGVSATIFGSSCPGAGIIMTIAGNGTVGDGGDHGPAASATLNQPSGVAVDGAGNLYIADTANNVIRKITAATGVITTVAGNGTAGFGGDTLAASSPLAELNAPQGVSLDAGGNLYIADTFNQRIRRVDAVTGILTTVAGNGTAGYGGDSLLATSSQTKLNFPDAVAFDSQSNMYIADSLNNRVRVVKASTGIIATFAGNGVVGDTGDGFAASAAELDAPSGVVVDPAGNVYIADTQNYAIRKVSSAASPAPGIISTVAKKGNGEYFYNNTFYPVNIYGPLGLFLDGSGNLYFADSLNMVIREIQSNFVALDFTKTQVRQGSTSTTQNQMVENDGNAPLSLTAPDIFVGTNAALNPARTTCSTGNPFLAVDADCVIGAVFAPALPPDLVFAPGVSSEPLTPDIDIGKTGDTLNSPLVIELDGVATPLNSTTLVLASSRNPSNFGQSVTFTATVTTGAGTGNLTGTVTFYDNNGASTLQAGVPLISGVASYTTSALAVGTHHITAAYNGDSLHFPSNGTLTPAQQVGEVTSTSLLSSANPSVLGISVTFTATVSVTGGGSVPLDGTVTFTDTTGTILGSQTIGASGIATLSTAALTYGQHTITASYSGDLASGILASSAALTQDVQAPSTTTLTSSPNPSIYGSPVSFTVTVPAIGSTAATGTVNILQAGQVTPINSVSLTAGAATFTISALPVGTDSITASYQGDLYYGPSTSPAVSQTVNQATTATTVIAAPNPAVFGKPVTITATVRVTLGVSTPSGNVTFTDSLNGGAAVTLGSVALGGAGTASISPALLAGSHSIVATYAGDTNDTGSASAPYSLTVTQESITLSSSPNPSIYGSPVSFTVTVPAIGSTAATGTVNILQAGQVTPIKTVSLTAGTVTFTISSLPVGTDSITASYLGDSIYIPIVSSAVSQVVNPAQTSTSLAAVPSLGIAGAPVAITATVHVTQGASTPTGNVTFTDTFNGATVPLGASTPLTGGAATINLTLALGAHSIVATYAGDTNDAGSSSTSLALIVVQAATTTTLTSSGSPSLVLAPVTFTAHVASIGGGTPAGNVTFLDSLNGGATVILACSPQPVAPTAACTTSALVAGTHSITAIYAGDTNDVSSTTTISQVVGTIPTVTGLGVSTTGGANPQLILVAAVVNNPTAIGSPTPTGTVIFSTVVGSTLTQIGSSTLDSSGVATMVPSLATGTYNLEVSYGGDANHSPSTSNVVHISTTPVGFNLTVTPASVTIPATQSATVTVALTSTNSFADTIGLGCASLPAGVNCHFSSPNATLSANGSQNVSLTIDTNNPLGGGASAMNIHPGSREVSLAGLFLPLSTLFGLLFWRFRRRYARLLTMALLLGAAALVATGCSGSFSQTAAAPGTYVIQVIGVGATSNISQYQNVTLIVTK